MAPDMLKAEYNRAMSQDGITWAAAMYPLASAEVRKLKAEKAGLEADIMYSYHTEADNLDTPDICRAGARRLRWSDELDADSPLYSSTTISEIDSRLVTKYAFTGKLDREPPLEGGMSDADREQFLRMRQMMGF